MKPVHVNPHHVKKSKELDDNNPNKNDRKAPKTIAALVNEGRFSYPYLPTGIYAEIRSLSNLRFQTQEELTRLKNRIARWFSIYFPEYKDVYGDLRSEAPEAARIELRNLLNDMDVYTSRLEELFQSMEEKLKDIPYVDKLMEIKEIGLVTVGGFIAEVGDIGRFENPKQRRI